MPVDRVVETYAAAWLETDASARRQLLERAWAEDGTYTDPERSVTGREALDRAIAAFQEQRPGDRIVMSSGVDQHHGLLRLTWCWIGADGAPIMEGRSTKGREATRSQERSRALGSGVQASVVVLAYTASQEPRGCTATRKA